MKNKKGANTLAVLLVLGVFIVIAMLGVLVYYSTGTRQQAVGGATESAVQISQATKTGDIAQIKGYVYDISNNNINTKVAVAVYCQDDLKNMILDGIASSTSAEFTVTTNIGRTVTCWAFNSTMQTKAGVTIDVKSEKEPIRLEVFRVPNNAQIAFYNDQYATGTNGAINVTAGADSTGTLQKMRIKNNNTDYILPIGGLYFDKVVGSNISTVDISGGAIISGGDHVATKIVPSTLGTSVSARTELWNYVFEFDDDAATAGNQVLYLDEADYVDTGTVSVKANGNGCVAASTGDQLTAYGFTKGFYRQTKADGIGYGHETDASTAAVITQDLQGQNIMCTQ